jgi:hypothetical protein
MSFAIRVAGEDPALRSRVALWIDRMALAPPVPLTLTLRVGEPPSIEDPRPLFRQPTVEIRSGPPQEVVHLSWQVAPAVAVLQPAVAEARVVLSLAAVRHLDICLATFLTTVVIFLLRRAGWHHVHGATAIDPGGRGWLVAGNARCGKSTLAALVASRGWAVGSDDSAFLAALEGRPRVAALACRHPIALRRGGQALLNRKGGTFDARRRKVAYWPEELGGSWAPCVEPDVLLFATVGNRRSRAEPISPREALAELVRWSAWVVLESDLAQPHLDLLARLAAQTRGYRVTLGRDLFAAPDRLAKLL